ncbi:MAG: Trp biosynthesis-associated membrane protein [Propionibacteriaceae bacterium]
MTAGDSATAPVGHPSPSNRTRSYAFGLLALGGLGGLISAAQPWWVGAAEGSNVTFSGTETTGGLAQAVPFVLLAGTLLALALRARGRAVLGAVLAVAAVGGVVAGVLRPAPPRELVLTRLQAVTLGDTYQLESTAWSSVFVLAALLALAGGVLMLVRAGRWPTRAARFERAATSGQMVPAVPETSEAALWSALDAGVDPTDDPTPAAEGAPIRTSPADGVTMGISASRPTPAGSSRSGQAAGAVPTAASTETAGLDTDATRTTAPRRPGSEGE